MNWFCCKYFYTIGCNLSCDCLNLNLEAIQDGTHTIEYSYQNSNVVHSIQLTDVEIGDTLSIPKSFNPNNYIWIKIVQPDGSYLTTEFLDELGDPILDVNTGEPITSSCYVSKIYQESVHYPVSILDGCEDCTIAKGYASSYLSFFDERNTDIHYIKIGNNLINLNNFDGAINTEGLTATNVHTEIADYFANTTNPALLQLIDDYSLAITTFPDKIRIRTKSIMNGNDVCNTRVQFFDERLYPIDTNNNPFQCCYENEELPDICQYSEEEAMFYIKFNQVPDGDGDVYFTFNADNPATTLFKLKLSNFLTFNDLDDSIEIFNDFYDDYYIKRVSYQEILLYTSKYKCDDTISVYKKVANATNVFINISVIINNGATVEASCCDFCDYQDFATFRFIPNVSLPTFSLFNTTMNAEILELPPLDVNDIPSFLVAAQAMYPTHGYSIVSGAVVISIPLSESPGYICGQNFDFKIGTQFIDSIIYPNDQIIECCFD